MMESTFEKVFKDLVRLATDTTRANDLEIKELVHDLIVMTIDDAADIQWVTLEDYDKADRSSCDNYYSPLEYYVDLVVAVVKVHRNDAKQSEPIFRMVLDNMFKDKIALADGFTLETLANELGLSKEDALKLLAIGEYLEFWRIITPEQSGSCGKELWILVNANQLEAIGYQPESK